MKAFALESSDRPARIMDIPKPEVGEADALVAVKAASVNGIDVYQAMGALTGMMEHAFPTVVGRDFAGTVESAGPGFRGFAVGDAVFGFIPAMPPLKSGAFAEFVPGGPSAVLAPKPAGLGFSEAAALPLAGSAALDLLEAIDARKGDIVLIVGATGGVGSFAVQLAAQRGLKVIATALPDQVEYVRSLGAADTIDYSAGNVAAAVRSRYPDGIAALIDVVNRKETLPELTSLVRQDGHVATLMGAADVEQLAASGISGTNVMAAPTAEKLRLLAGMAASGELRVQIHATFPIDRADEALQAFQAGTRGKVILAF
ncbi:MAG: NADP-dependent oxidoreductase [Candidatus Limnocylindrales bacterium]|jgi:NADPH:quinone reductase-like Zn-dependent oxidoreductase